MAEPATIARPYAQALFRACEPDLASAEVWLEELSAVAANSELTRFAKHPRVDAAQIVTVITDALVAATGHALPPVANHFLRMVVDAGRLDVLPEISQQFRALHNERSGLQDAVIYSAFPMDDTTLAKVSAVLEQRFGRRLRTSVVLQPDLIGGVKVVVGDEVLDTSVKARLDHMKATLVA